MQPQTPQSKPVMDVTAPARPAVSPTPTPATPAVPQAAAPAASQASATQVSAPAVSQPATPQALAVHEAPKATDEEPETASNDVHDEPGASKSEVNSPQHKPAPIQKPTPAQPPGPPLPIGAIVMTVIVMIVLAAAAIAVYLKS